MDAAVMDVSDVLGGKCSQTGCPNYSASQSSALCDLLTEREQAVLSVVVVLGIKADHIGALCIPKFHSVSLARSTSMDVACSDALTERATPEIHQAILAPVAVVGIQALKTARDRAVFKGSLEVVHLDCAVSRVACFYGELSNETHLRAGDRQGKSA